MDEHYYQQYYVVPTQYEPMFWPELVAIVIDIFILVALGAWVLSTVRKAWKGEEVEIPL